MKKILLLLISSVFISAMIAIPGRWGIVFNSPDLKILKYPKDSYLKTLAKRYNLKSLSFKDRELSFYSREDINYTKVTKSILDDLEKNHYIKIDKKIKELILEKIKSGRVNLFYKAKNCPAIPFVVEERVNIKRDFMQSPKGIRKAGYYSVQNNCRINLDKNLCPVLECFK